MPPPPFPAEVADEWCKALVALSTSFSTDEVSSPVVGLMILALQVGQLAFTRSHSSTHYIEIKNENNTSGD